MAADQTIGHSNQVLCSLLQTLSLSEKRAVQSAMPVRLAASALQSALTRDRLTQQLVLL